jgi:hypothetical protein
MRGERIMKLSGTALVLAAALLAVETAAAADQYGAPPRNRGVYAAEAPQPLVLPPCRDSFWGVLLHCVPRADIYPAYDDLYVQNQIRGLRPPQRKPYIQVFSW